MGKKKLIYVLILAVVLIGTTTYLVNSRKSKQEEKTDAVPINYETVLVEKGDVEKVIYATGSIIEGAREEIRPAVTGKVKQVFVEEGQEVKAGDLLFTLDDTEISLAYAREKLAYEKLEKEYNKEAKATVKAQITAPISGEVTEVLVKSEDELSPQRVIAKIVKSDLFELTVPFNWNDVKQLKEGQEVEVLMTDYFSYVPGTIKEINQKGRSTPEGGIVYNVTVEIANPGALKEGDKGLVEIDTGSRLIRSIGTSNLKIPEPIEVKAQSIGKVAEVLVEAGDQVAAGSVLVRLDVESHQESLEAKKLELELARMNLMAKAQELEKYQVRAPIAGKIVELNVEAGKEVPSDKAAVVIANLEDIKMVVQVEEVDVPLVKIGQEATVYTLAYGDQPFKAIVTSIAEKGKVENNTVTFATELTLLDPGPLKPGMTGDADILVDRKKNVMRLPVNAVQIFEEGKGTVMVKGPNGEPEPLEVEVGIEGVEYVEILSGLNVGDEVLILPGY